MCIRDSPYPVFLSREVPEFTGDDRLADKFGEFILVVHVLVLFLDAEYGGFPRTVAGTEKDMPPEGGERCPVIRVVLFLYLVVPVFVVDLRAPAYHVYGVVVEQFELAVQFRDVVAGGCSRVEDLVPEPPEYAQDVSCTLRCWIGDFVRLVEDKAQLAGSAFHETHQSSFQFPEHGGGDDKECPFRYVVEVAGGLYCTCLLYTSRCV